MARGWVGDTLACTAAATSLSRAGYSVDFYYRWPQLKTIFQDERRFRPLLYKPRPVWLPISKPWQRTEYDLTIIEPTPWSYREPFTSEIRRMAGFDPIPEFSITRPAPKSQKLDLTVAPSSRPRICISRDIKKRSYGRDIDELVSFLSEFVDVSWIGLSPALDSKKGQRLGMEVDIQTLMSSDAYFGPEGGMLWLAAGLGVRTIYLTEHIHALEKKFGPGVHKTLGMVNVFPKGKHTALAPGLPNKDVVQKVADLLALARMATILV